MTVFSHQLTASKRKRYRTICQLMTVSCLLASCSSYQETFDCEAGKGLGCKSISQVNQLTQDSLQSTVISTQLSPGDGRLTPDLRRVSEEQVKVWIAPFQDDHGNFHEASVIHTVIKPGYWHVSQGGIW